MQNAVRSEGREDTAARATAFGRLYLEKNQVDAAIELMSMAVLKGPSTAPLCFTLATAYARQGLQDAAGMMFTNAWMLADENQTPEACKVRDAARQNALLISQKLLPRDWLPALHDPGYHGPWLAALAELANQLRSAWQEQPTSMRAPESVDPMDVRVLGGLGWPAAALNVFLLSEDCSNASSGSLAGRHAHGSSCAPSCSGGADRSGMDADVASAVGALSLATATPKVRLTSVHPNQLSTTMARAVLRANASATTAARTFETDHAVGAGGGSGGSTDAAVVSGANAAQSASPASLQARVCRSAADVLLQSPALRGVGRTAAAAGASVPPDAAAGCPARVSFGFTTCPAGYGETQSTGALHERVTANVTALVCFDAVGPDLPFARLAAEVSCIALTQPSAACSVLPAAASVWGVLVESASLTELNQVDLEAMHQDAGLHYAPVNEMLWRHCRKLQVDKYTHRCLGPPGELLRLSAAELRAFEGHPPAANLARSLAATSDGRADCVVTWMEYEVAPGAAGLSYAPGSCAVGHVGPGRPSCHLLTPHVWQRVHYLPVPVQVSAGFSLQLSCALRGDELRIEQDESAAVAVAPAGAGACAAQVGSKSAGSSTPDEQPPGSGGVGIVSTGLPEGDALESDRDAKSDSGSSSGSSEASGGGGHSDVLAFAIPQYHLSMLNDRARTRCYRAGIEEAVARLMGSRAPQGDPAASAHTNSAHTNSAQGNTAEDIKGTGGGSAAVAPDAGVTASPVAAQLVLDVGAGTGLLSMLAARAGAGRVLAVERELSLAITASTLVHLNALEAAVSVAHTTTRALRLGGGSVGGAAGAAGVLTAIAAGDAPRASLVIHEIFGTDPLSEQVLTTMRHIKESLADPGAMFMPARFRSVAALASCKSLWAMAKTHPPPGHVVADVSPLLLWSPWKVELELEELPEMVLRSEPQVVLSWDLSATTLPLSGGANVPVVLCGPTPVQEYACTHVCRRHAGNDGSSTSGMCDSKTSNLAVDCVVSWFEIDLGAGGWLSTGPISSCPHDAPISTSIRAGCGGHWTQSVQLLPEPLSFVPESGRCLLQARYMVDRVIFSVRSDLE